MRQKKDYEESENYSMPFGEKELMDMLENKKMAIEEAEAEMEEEKSEQTSVSTTSFADDEDVFDPQDERQDNMQKLRANLDHLATYDPHTWSHNTRYLPGLLKNVNPLVGGIAVDYFCQRGDLARTLSPNFSEVIGLDISPKMIEVAKRKSEGYENVKFVCADFLEYDIPENSCGLIVMVATLHHMPKEEVIAKVKRCLKHSGRLIIVDIFRPATIGDIVSSLISNPLNTIGLKLFDKHHASAEEMVYWREHSSLDSYDSIPAMRQFAKEVLPGAIIKRKMFWRYTLEWVKP